MKFLNFFATLILMLTMLTSSTLAGRSMTLEQCLDTGIENNPTLNASRLEIEAANYDIKAVRADFFPSISSSFSMGNIDSISASGRTEEDYIDQDNRSFSLKLSQILFAGFRIVNTYKRYELAAQVSVANMELERLQLVNQIETTFFKLMKSRQDMINVEESVKRLEDSVNIAEAFFKRELVPRVEVLQAQVDLADAKEQLAKNRNDVTRERLNLLSLMNLQLDEDIRFVSGGYNQISNLPTYEECEKFAFENRPDIKSLINQRRLIEKDAKIESGKYMPVVTFDVGYYDQDRDYRNPEDSIFSSTDRDQRNRYYSGSVTVSWDLFDGGRAWYTSRKHLVDLKRIDALIRDAKNTISTGIKKALFSISEAEDRIKSSTGIIEAAKENYEMEQKRLKAGISSISSLLDAQARLIRAQVNEAQSYLDYQLAKSELELMRGEKINPE